MYLSHFGFSRQPFNNVTATDFFYGANRGEMLDALVYVLTHGEGDEGIIEVTGEAGSGKTTLCRLLMRRLPANVKTIYLDKLDLSREELFQAIADELNFKLTESCIIAASTIVALCELQGALIEQHADGRQVVLLLDEAHTLPAETLEALRLLYELESSRHKLMQIVLFGQAELKTTLALPQMRQFRDRVTHHFVTQPLNAKAVKEYLILRKRAAGYRGPGIFAPDAVNLIAAASGGLVPQINLLADKSLQAAFTAHAPDIRAKHVKAAIRDSEDSGIRHRVNWWDGSNLLNNRGAGAGAVLALVALGALVWDALRPEPTDATPTAASVPVEVMTSSSIPSPVYSAAVERAVPNSSPPASAFAPGHTAPPVSSVPTVSSAPPLSSAPPVSSEAGAGKIASIASAQSGQAAPTEQQNTNKLGIGGVKLTGYGLLEQRVEATKKVMAATDKNYYTIQLFATENIQPERMERFLSRAQNVVNLSDLYMHPVTNEGQAKFRVTYGIYPSREQAGAALEELPQKYKTSFHPELYTLGELR